MSKTKKSSKKKAPAKVKARKPAKAAQSNGSGIAPVPKTGPNLTLRARSLDQIEKFKKAAEGVSLSLNTWAIEVLSRAAAA